MIAIDANFRLKRRAVSNNARDPALGSGWGYFVEDTAYAAYVMQHASQEDVSLPIRRNNKALADLRLD